MRVTLAFAMSGKTLALRKPSLGHLTPPAARKHQAVAFLHRFNTEASTKYKPRNS